MLNANSVSLLGSFPDAGTYSTDERRVSASLARHHLAVQRAVLNRQIQWDKVIPERLMKERGKKIPDAVLIKGDKKTALEVELTQKTRSKIFLAFTDHARAFRDGGYHAIEYVFDDAQMCKTYQTIFDEERWPVFRYSKEKKRYVEEKEMFSPSSLPGFKEAMKFTVERLMYD
jgi:hypothetical protein